MDCLVTKLKGTVNDVTLMKLNEVKIKLTHLYTIGSVDSIEHDGHLYNNADGNNVTVRIHGNASASPQTGGDILLSNLSNGDTLFISPKDVYTQLSYNVIMTGGNFKLFCIDIEGLLPEKLKELSLRGWIIKDIKRLPKSSVNKVFRIGNFGSSANSLTSVVADVDIDDIYALYPNIDTLSITQCPIRLKNLADIKKFNLKSVEIYSLVKIDEENSALNIEDFASVRTFDVAVNVSGDYFGVLNGTEHPIFCCNGTFTYDSQTFEGTKVGQIGGDNFNIIGNVDTLLQNLAENVTKLDSGNGWITFNTPRTSASDEAVNTLERKGFIIKIPKQE